MSPGVLLVARRGRLREEEGLDLFQGATLGFGDTGYDRNQGQDAKAGEEEVRTPLPQSTLQPGQEEAHQGVRAKVDYGGTANGRRTGARAENLARYEP